MPSIFVNILGESGSGIWICLDVAYSFGMCWCDATLHAWQTRSDYSLFHNFHFCAKFCTFPHNCFREKAEVRFVHNWSWCVRCVCRYVFEVCMRGKMRSFNSRCENTVYVSLRFFAHFLHFFASFTVHDWLSTFFVKSVDSFMSFVCAVLMCRYVCLFHSFLSFVADF